MASLVALSVSIASTSISTLMVLRTFPTEPAMTMITTLTRCLHPPEGNGSSPVSLGAVEAPESSTEAEWYGAGQYMAHPTLRLKWRSTSETGAATTDGQGRVVSTGQEDSGVNGIIHAS
ncbi:hypothetical protein EDB19DRAFT_1825925 [Suillus lakei]|nr:hypothetical protein EDB19DRAFT_1825925 [Suillus lakei]